MTDRIWVQVADEGRRVPVEGRRGVYFEHVTKHNVRHTAFIGRRIAEGDLIKVDAPAETAAVAPAAPASAAAAPPPAAPSAPISAAASTTAASTASAAAGEKGA